MGAHKPPRKPRKGAGWGLTWLELLKDEKPRTVQFSLPMTQPLVTIQGYNTESDVSASRAFINHVPDDDYPSQTHGDILCEALCQLRGIAREPCLMGGIGGLPGGRHGAEPLGGIPSIALDELPAAVAKVGFWAVRLRMA